MIQFLCKVIPDAASFFKLTEYLRRRSRTTGKFVFPVQSLIFRSSVMMKLQDLHIKRFRTDRETAAVKLRKMFRHPGKLLRIIVHSGDCGNPDQKRWSNCRCFRQMLQNGIQIAAGAVAENL